jgi:hypothetical protein
MTTAMRSSALVLSEEQELLRRSVREFAAARGGARGADGNRASAGAGTT